MVFPSSPSLKAGLNTMFLSSKSNFTLQKGDKEGSKHSDKWFKFWYINSFEPSNTNLFI